MVSQEASKPSDFAATEQLNPVLEISSAPLGSEATQEATFSQEAIEESVEAQDSSVMKTEEQQMPEFTLEDAQQMQGEPIVESFDTPSVSEDSGVMKVTEQELAAMNTSDALPQYSSAEIASEESFQESSTMELLQEPELVSQEVSETIPYSKNEAAVFAESSTPTAFSTTP